MEEADNEEIPMRDLHVEALSQSWFATRGTDYISPLFTYLAPSISKYYKMRDRFEDMVLAFDNPAAGQGRENCIHADNRRRAYRNVFSYQMEI